jgi:hypothetical protein
MISFDKPWAVEAQRFTASVLFPIYRWIHMRFTTNHNLTDKAKEVITTTVQVIFPDLLAKANLA